jgi:hypothetical protein
MTCKYFDSGWCYAPEDVEHNSKNGSCIDPLSCPYRKSQMTNQQLPDIIEIGGVKYQRIVEEPKPQTLFQHLNSFGIVGAEGICNIVRGWLIDNTVIETEDAERVTFTIHKEQLQTPK